MKKLAAALAALAFAAPVLAASRDIAPAVKRKPAATAPVPTAPAATSTTPAATSTAPVAPQQAVRTGNERDYIAALTAAGQGGGDAALDTGLIRVMGRLLAAGRCGEATGLAARDGRKELAARARQLCK